MKTSALPRDMDLDAMVEILTQSLRDRPGPEQADTDPARRCAGAACCGRCTKRRVPVE